MNVLGIDPGFANVGYAVVNIQANYDQVLAMGLIRTEKANKKAKTRASEDNLVRAKEIAAELVTLIDRHHISIICAETMSYPRNAAAAAPIPAA
jgi:Holliday junction resolvasome RuvABC endonuclease subunit